MQFFKSRTYFRGLSFTAVLFVLRNQNFMLKVDQYRYFVILANNRYVRPCSYTAP